MIENAPEPLGGGLAYEDRLPLRWRLMTGETPLVLLSSAHDANEQFLRRVAAIEDESSGITESHPDLAKEFQRIESKLDLMLDMVSAALAGQMKLPKPTSIRMTAQGIVWTSDKAPKVGSRLSIELYLISRYPYPLVLAGLVQSVEKLPTGTQVTLLFDEMGEALRGWLEKTIFRQHRRQVAQSRQNYPARDRAVDH